MLIAQAALEIEAFEVVRPIDAIDRKIGKGRELLCPLRLAFQRVFKRCRFPTLPFLPQLPEFLHPLIPIPAFRFLHGLREPRQDLEEVPDDSEVGELKNRRIRIFVDGDDVLRARHACQMLRCA